MAFAYNQYYFMEASPYIIGNPELRQPQVQGWMSVYDHFVTKKKETHALLVIPTGIGKTGLMALLPYGIANGRVLIIAPQLTIKDTVMDGLNPASPENFWIKRQVFSKNKDLPVLIEYDGDRTPREVLDAANIVVVNIQKLQSRLETSFLNFLPNSYFDMIIIDEAHHSTARTWVEVVSHFSKAKVIKVTGTPIRTDQNQIAGELVYKYKLSQAMANAYVKSLENIVYIPDELYLTIDNNQTQLYSVDQIFDMGLKDEEWVSRSVAYSIDCSRKVVSKSAEILKRKRHNSTVPHKIIAVACSIEHALQIKNLYEELDLETTIVHSKLTKEQKDKAFSDIKNHRVQVVVNVSMLGEGYDHPYLSIGAIFRPFRHPLPYAQFIGRILRCIPDEEVTCAEDNVAEIISHKHLALDDLWSVYRQEINESEIIKHLKVLDVIEEQDIKDGSSQTEQKRDYGIAQEQGDGYLVSDAYLNTELIRMKKESDKKYEEQVQKIQELFGISRDKAVQLVNQANSNDSAIKRPDLFFANRKKEIDVEIRERIVPELITTYNIDQYNNDLSNCGLFKGKFAWIANKAKDNGAMLAMYFNCYLKSELGKKKQDWTIDDYDIAYKKLSIGVDYVSRILQEFIEE